MDMQMTIAANAAQTSGTTNAANGAASSTGKTAAGLFAGVLQAAGGSAGGSGNEPNAMLGAEMLATLSVVPQSLQQLISQLQEAAGGEQTLLVKLISSLGEDPNLAKTLLSDKDMRDWLQDASALLSLLAPATMQQFGAMTLGSQTQSDFTSADNAEDALKLQMTLLTLATMLEKQPNDSLLGSLANGLEKALAPFTEQLNAAQQKAEAAATQSATPAIASEGANKSMPSANHAQHAKQQANGQQDASNASANRADQLDAAVSVQTKAASKLELLTAKGSFSAAVLTGGNETQSTSTEQANAADKTQDWLPGMPLHLALKTQHTVELKAPTPTVSAANFAEQMGQFFVKSMKVSLLASGASEATLSLQPQNLGNIDVKITMQNGHLIAHIATQSAAAKEILESQLPQLRMMLQNQGLQVEKLEVTQNSHASSSMFHDQQPRQQSFGREQSGGRSGSNDGAFRFDEAASTIDAVETGEQARISSLGYGSSSFVATA